MYPIDTVEVKFRAQYPARGTDAPRPEKNRGVTAVASRRDLVSTCPPELDRVFQSVETYYTGKLVEYGATPMGVDWSCQATQWLRFVQLLKLCTFDTPFSLNDLGCGYGELAVFLHQRHPQASVDYLGIDLAPAMVQRARRRHRGEQGTRFAVGRTCQRRAHYSVASGIMNVMLGYPLPVWEEFVRGILNEMHSSSLRGFAVNFCSARR